MAVLSNNDEEKKIALSKYDVDSIKGIVRFIINKYNDLNKHDQYALFLELSEIPLLKSEFFEHRDNIINILKKKFDNENVKMEYYVTVDLPDTHLKMTNALKRNFFYWESRFNEEKNKNYPNDYLLKMFTELMLDTADRASKFNLGTPVMVWVQRRAKLIQNNTKTISIKSFGGELNINKYNSDSTKQDPLTNGDNNRSTVPSTSPGTVTSFEQQREQDGRSVRLSGTGEGQHIQAGSSDTANKGGTESIQGGDDRRETEELF